MNELTSMNTNSSTTDLVLNPDAMKSMYEIAKVMATASVTVPKHLQGSPADCLAVVMQAAQWRMNPFAVSQKTHLVNGTLGYEAQLVNAVIGSSRAVSGRFKYEVKNEGNVNVAVRCGAVLAGEQEITWGQWIHAADQTVKNSPLWKTDPVQQLSYLAIKRWARLYCPDVILGVYSVDELMDAAPTKDMGKANVVTGSKTLDGILSAAPETTKPEQSAPLVNEGTKSQPEPEQDNPEGVRMMIEIINGAKNLDQLNELVDDIKTSPRLNDNDRRQLRAVFSEKKKALETEAAQDLGDMF